MKRKELTSLLGEWLYVQYSDQSEGESNQNIVIYSIKQYAIMPIKRAMYILKKYTVKWNTTMSFNMLLTEEDLLTCLHKTEGNLGSRDEGCQRQWA